MKINSRNKGACGEREFASIIHELTDVKLVRNLEQTRSGGHDLIVDGGSTDAIADRFRGLAIEVKRYKTVTESNIRKWWLQAQKQGESSGLEPILAYRGNNQQWRVIMPLHIINPDRHISSEFNATASVAIHTFCRLLE